MTETRLFLPGHYTNDFEAFVMLFSHTPHLSLVHIPGRIQPSGVESLENARTIKMPRRTNPFQKLTNSIMAVFHEPEFEVIESPLVYNQRTGAVRELDILIMHRKDKTRKILVECRDHRRKQDVRWIDELQGKAQRLNFQKVIAVSSSGFYRTALAEASERGIHTLHLREAEEVDWQKWRFGLDKFGVVVNFDLLVTGVQFVVPPGFAGAYPNSLKQDKVVIIDTKKKSKIRLVDWIAGFRKDPKVRAEFAKRDENDAINHYTYTIPCDPWIGFVAEPDNQIIPLSALVLSVDSIRAEYSVPLKHYDVEGQRVHVGESTILGHETKLVLHETDGQLKIMIEQLVNHHDLQHRQSDKLE